MEPTCVASLGSIIFTHYNNSKRGSSEEEEEEEEGRRMNRCDMDSTDKVEIAKQAIKEIMEEDEVSEHKPTAKHLLFRLLSQLDSLQEEDSEKLCPEEKPKELWDSLQKEDVGKLCPEVDKTEEKSGKQLDSLQEVCPEVDKTAEIIKEVRNVKRQNLITHCLVSTMILLTAAWQISEVSLLLKVKNGLNNPFNFFGGIIKDLILKGARHEVDGEQSSGRQKPAIKAPLIELPDIPFFDLSIFDSTDEE